MKYNYEIFFNNDYPYVLERNSEDSTYTSWFIFEFYFNDYHKIKKKESFFRTLNWLIEFYPEFLI